MKKNRRKKKKQSRLPILLTAVLLLLGLAAAVLLQENPAQEPQKPQLPRNPYSFDGFSEQTGRMAYADGVFRSETGIDVSEHQGEIDWEAVAADGITFALIRIGYRGYSDGNLGEDPYFRRNFEAAKAAGLDTGVYFFSQAVTETEARREAEYVLRLLDGAELEEPVFFDWEYIDDAPEARTAGMSGEEITRFAKTFCDRISSAGYPAGVYFNQNTADTLIDRAALLDYPLWLAQYADRPDYLYDFAWWQYSDCGTVAGIDPPVDLDIRFVKAE